MDHIGLNFNSITLRIHAAQLRNHCRIFLLRQECLSWTLLPKAPPLGIYNRFFSSPLLKNSFHEDQGLSDISTVTLVPHLNNRHMINDGARLTDWSPLSPSWGNFSRE